MPHRVLLSIALLSLAWALSIQAAELKDAQHQFLAGDYSSSLRAAQKAIEDQPDDEDWQSLLIQALLATGKYPEALQAATNALAHDSRSIKLRWQAQKAYASNGQVDRSNELVDEIVQTVSSRTWAYRDAPNLVIFGQAALKKGADPKRVLNQLFDSAKKADPTLRDVYIAAGALALDKHDFDLAAKRFQEGLKQLPEDPDLHFGLGAAFAPTDDALMISSLQKALERNTNHVPSLLLFAEHHIDAEDYDEAKKTLDRIEKTNPWDPDAWAFRSIIGHLLNDRALENSALEKALKFFPQNPRVNYLIGRKLSQKYRFAEGASHQRKALEDDPAFLPARAQLAQDLLRLGDESEGWKLAEVVQKQDPYDVEAYNLANLHDTMKNFATVTNDEFLIRMTRHEAAVYGPRVLQLLTQARSNLCAKYDLQVKRPTTVEVFADQKDFAVRTFGMPGNPGYLGVCFGSVVTANGPGARFDHPVNWQAVLWHEFCHVVTLQLTHNKMPRWLSEGISVYEEFQANPTWGQHMNARYRQMIMDEELTPISKLSGAFLAPRSEEHLQFAYYESSLVVEFLVERFGLAKLKAILHDLRDGADINQTIEKHTSSMSIIEGQFAAFARQRALELAPSLDFEKPDFESADDDRPNPRRSPPPGGGGTPEQWNQWVKDHPTNLWAILHQADTAFEAQEWAAAKPLLQKLVDLYPQLVGPDSPYRMLATVHRALNDTNAELQVLKRFAELDDEAPDAYMRLMELGRDAKDWSAVLKNGERYLAVNPLVAPPYRFVAEAADRAGHSATAIESYRALLELDPPDPAELHFRLAQLLHRAKDPEAKRHLLDTLEEAPRYRAALALLLEMQGPAEDTKPPLKEGAAQ
jgi:tetratricopeptide (TPR) repeat protein